MISDVLFEAVQDLDRYLNDKFYDTWYKGAFRERIIKLRNEAEAIRIELDKPPTP